MIELNEKSTSREFANEVYADAARSDNVSPEYILERSAQVNQQLEQLKGRRQMLNGSHYLIFAVLVANMMATFLGIIECVHDLYRTPRFSFELKIGACVVSFLIGTAGLTTIILLHHVRNKLNEKIGSLRMAQDAFHSTS